jgi:hypothetical protein
MKLLMELMTSLWQLKPSLYVRVHGLKGRAFNFAMGATTTASLHAFFEGMKAHACPRATRFVQTASGFELREDNEEVMDLPTSSTKRAIFDR